MFIDMKKVFPILFVAMVLLAPLPVLADFDAGQAPFAQGQPVDTLVNNIINATLNLIWILLVIFAIIMFIVAGFQFLSARGEPEEIKKAQQSMLWGAVGMVVAIIAFSVPKILVAWFSGG